MNIPLLILSFLVAFLLSVITLPESLMLWRPEWAALILFYWVLQAPEKVGLGLAWTVGLLLDVLEGTLFGLNALSLAVVAYLLLTMHQRIKMFPLLQQSLTVFMVIGINVMLVHWVKSLTGYRPADMTFLFPAISSALIWPILYLVMNRLDRY